MALCALPERCVRRPDSVGDFGRPRPSAHFRTSPRLRLGHPTQKAHLLVKTTTTTLAMLAHLSRSGLLLGLGFERGFGSKASRFFWALLVLAAVVLLVVASQGLHLQATSLLFRSFATWRTLSATHFCFLFECTQGSGVRAFTWCGLVQSSPRPRDRRSFTD